VGGLKKKTSARFDAGISLAVHHGDQGIEINIEHLEAAGLAFFKIRAPHRQCIGETGEGKIDIYAAIQFLEMGASRIEP
jgi:hypothetical protein